MRRPRVFRLLWPIAALLALALTTHAQLQAGAGQPASQSVSQTGLLPVYGVDFSFDASWVDSAKFPSQSSGYSNSGVSEVFQRVWDSLAAGGFNVIRFAVDVRDARPSAFRVANLCVWAKNNNVKLLPILVGAEHGRELDSDFPKNAAEFLKALLHALRKDDNQHIEAYSQILAFQIDNEMNHTVQRRVSALDGQKHLMRAAAEVRGAEEKLLKETGLNSTPLMVNASFDYELIRSRAIAGVTLTDDVFARSYESLKQFLARLADIPDVDIVGVDWFAGSLSSGSAERFPDLLRSLTADLAGKQIIFTTGFSTAFSSPEDQKSLCALAFSNLADHRASEGIDSPFTGVIFREATNRREPDPAPPSPRTSREMTTWNWAARADQLTRMWSGQASSDEMAWWLKKIESNFGLLAISGDGAGATVTASPALEALKQIATSVSEASNSMLDDAARQPDPGQSDVDLDQPVPPDSPPTGESTPGSSGTGMRSALKQRVQEGMMGLLDRAFERINIKLFGPRGQTPAPEPGSPPADPGIHPTDPGNPTEPGPGASAQLSLVKSEIRLEPARPLAGQPVTVSLTLHNQSPDRDASGLIVALLSEAGTMLDPAAIVNDAAVPRGSSQTISLQWTPGEQNTYRISVGVFDSTGANQLAGAALDPVSVAAGTGGTASTFGSDGLRNMTGGRNAARALGSAGIISGSQTIRIPLGLPLIHSFIIDPTGQRTGPAQAISTTFSLSNPLARPMSDVRAILAIDGRPVQTRNVGMLQPRQNRSLVFSNVALPQGSAHEIKLTITGGGQRRLTGFLSARVQVALTATTPGGPIGRPSPQPAPPGPNPNVRSIIPGTYRVGRLTLPAGDNPARVAGPAGSARATPQPPPRPDFRTMALPDLSVTASDIRYLPATPRPGEEVTFIISVRNNGGATAKAARVACVFYDGNRIVSREEFKETIEAGRVFSKKWKVKAPSGATLRLSVTATTAGDANTKDNTADVSVNGGFAGRGGERTAPPAAQPSPSPPSRNSVPNLPLNRGPLEAAPAKADLSVTANDIRLSPSSPKAGEIVSITLVVRNVGEADAKGARVLCEVYGDGRVVDREEASEDIKAGGAKTRRWKFKMPSARQVRVEVSSSLAQEPDARNNRASININMPGGSNNAPILPPGYRPPLTLPTAPTKPDMSVSVGDIHVSPALPRINDKLGFTINVRNVGNANAKGATVVCVLYADGRVAAQRHFNVDVRAGSSNPVQWSTVTPPAKQLRIAVTVSISQEAEQGNNRAVRNIAVAK